MDYGHILQTCSATHGLQIQRHNEVCEMLKRSFEKRGATVEASPALTRAQPLRSQTLYIVHWKDKLLVIGPIITTDCDDLEATARQKPQKYTISRQSQLREEGGKTTPGSLLHWCSISWRRVCSRDVSSSLWAAKVNPCIQLMSLTIH